MQAKFVSVLSYAAEVALFFIAAAALVIGLLNMQ
jgi:hypothetical protein